MMMAPKSFVEMEIAGKSRDQAIKEIKLLWKEIRRLKKEIEENHDSKDMMLCPMPGVKISVYRDYIEEAKDYFKSKGWEYEPSREETADKAFNDRLQDIKSIIFEYGGYFSGYKKRTITFDGEKILMEKDSILRDSDMEELLQNPYDDFQEVEEPKQNPSDDFQEMKKAELIEKLADFHLGEWRKEYVDFNVMDGTQWSLIIKFSSGKVFRSCGSNRFPYNFFEFLEITGISKADI